jgi:hypothetical protein
MSRDASLTEPFGDGDHHFRLAWAQLEKIQEACDAGPYVVLDRLASGRWRLEDIREVIRYGLIGGGMTPVEALKLVREYVEGRPPHESLALAQKIMIAGVVGAPEEEVGKKAEAASQEGEKPRSPTENSDLPPSTERAPS